MTFSGGVSKFVCPYKYKCAVEPTPTVNPTSIASNSIDFSVREIASQFLQGRFFTRRV